MANTPREGGSAIYLERKNGWFWVEPRGQMSIYHGPCRTQAEAEAVGRLLKRSADAETSIEKREKRMKSFGFRKTKHREV